MKRWWLVPLGLGTVLMVTALGAFAAAGGNFNPARKTRVEFNLREWDFGTVVGCGSHTSTYHTCIGPLRIVRRFGAF